MHDLQLQLDMPQYLFCPLKSKKRGKKRTITLSKSRFFSLSSELLDMVWTVSSRTRYGPDHIWYIELDSDWALSSSTRYGPDHI